MTNRTKPTGDEPCTALEERAAIVAEGCGLSQADALAIAKRQLGLVESWETYRPDW